MTTNNNCIIKRENNFNERHAVQTRFYCTCNSGHFTDTCGLINRLLILFCKFETSF